MSKTPVGALCALVATLGALAGCAREPDFRAYCNRAAPCEHHSVPDCVSATMELYRAQQQRGCQREGSALLACKTRYGRCETAAGFSLFMPTSMCNPEVQALFACLQRSPAR